MVLPTILKLVEVQAHHLQVELRMLTEPIVAGHVESAEIVHIVIDLCPCIRLRAAHAGVQMVVVVAVDAVPRHTADLARVHVPPLGVPLRIVLARKAVRIERVPDIHDELDVAELVHLAQHFVRNCLLAAAADEVPVGPLIPAPVSDHQEGPETVLRRGGWVGLTAVCFRNGPSLPLQGVLHQPQVSVGVGEVQTCRACDEHLAFASILQGPGLPPLLSRRHLRGTSNVLKLLAHAARDEQLPVPSVGKGPHLLSVAVCGEPGITVQVLESLSTVTGDENILSEELTRNRRRMLGLESDQSQTSNSLGHIGNLGRLTR
mmetsp:Transcript_28564/g.82062  ORF Transcript_28564/g.82062 Transcript_28564/m.82062 type:complete len:318 (+) Transcript_28564:965-1918(+)